MYYHFLILSLHISFFLIIGGEMLSLSRFNPKLHRHTHLFICDVQEVFSPLVYRSATVINNIALLNNVANILKIPVIVTEQYPKAFGRTVKEIGLNENAKIFEKTKFSMITEEIENMLNPGTTSRHSQTALNLLGRDESSRALFDVHVYIVYDAVSSQKCNDRAVAIRRLEKAGAIIVTTESLIFELLGDSKHENFKVVSALLKDSKKVPNEFSDDN